MSKNSDPTLFAPTELDSVAPAREPAPKAEPRLRTANRSQTSLQAIDLDRTIGPEHEARTIWRFVELMDLARFHAPIEAREGAPGRNATDPRILVALWLYATSQGVGSARELARLCESHDAYRWICGGVSVNHHLLSEFRVGHGDALDALFTQVLAVMMKKGLVTLMRTAQDGTRVRANAGAKSFRRKLRLKQLLLLAGEQVERVKKLAEDTTLKAREAAALERAAREREARIKEALEELPAAEAAKKASERDEARVSTTDPKARVMKMADGGFRPGYNVQFASTTGEAVIVGVAVTNQGSDYGQMSPMLEQIEQRTGQRPEQHLVDGGFASKEAISDAAKEGTEIYAPPMKKKKGDRPPDEPTPDDTPEVAEWRKRMATEEGKEIYKQRAATAELVNANVKERQGMKVLVRGTKKVLAIALWHALAYNLMRWAALTA